ncbi:hypothetical protein C8R45DRAFT_931630 [Mycena sanguinolenta]|nr:hypothetical protein C8R45DRAFT_931630 [Mycena sanguinolenta]
MIKDVAKKTEDALSKTKTVKDALQRRKTPKTNVALDAKAAGEVGQTSQEVFKGVVWTLVFVQARSPGVAQARVIGYIQPSQIGEINGITQLWPVVKVIEVAGDTGDSDFRSSSQLMVRGETCGYKAKVTANTDIHKGNRRPKEVDTVELRRLALGIVPLHPNPAESRKIAIHHHIWTQTRGLLNTQLLPLVKVDSDSSAKLGFARLHSVAPVDMVAWDRTGDLATMTS